MTLTHTMPDQILPDTVRREKLRLLLLRFLPTRGPVTITEILQRYPLPRQELEAVLAELVKAGVVYRGYLTLDAEEEQFCDRRNFEQIYRRAIQERRRALAPVPQERFLRFLWRWHGIGQLQNPGQLLPLLQRLRGLFLPLHFLEREILRARLPAAQFAQLFPAYQIELASLCQQGNLIWRLYQQDKGHARLVQFFFRGEGHLFFSRQTLATQAAQLSAPTKTAYQFLKENGASFFRDISAGANLPKPQLAEALAELAWAGLATNDSTQVLYELAEHGVPRQVETELSDTETPTTAGLQQFLEKALPEWRKRDHNLRRRRYARRKEALRNPSRPAETLQLTEGRWSLMEAFAIFGKSTAVVDNDATASQAFSLAQRQAYLLLERYGILVKEWYRREPARAESGLLPWYALFQALKRMEWRDEVRRGYFVEGLSGVQFALSHASEILANANSGETFSGPMMLSLLDPAVPYGGGVNLPLRGIDGQPLSLVRQASNHLLFVDAKAVVYTENYGARLWSVADATAQQLAASLSCLKQFLLLPDFLRPRKRIEVEMWNNLPVTDTPAATWLNELGFEKEEKKMVLWPSRL